MALVSPWVPCHQRFGARAQTLSDSGIRRCRAKSKSPCSRTTAYLRARPPNRGTLPADWPGKVVCRCRGHRGGSRFMTHPLGVSGGTVPPHSPRGRPARPPPQIEAREKPGPRSAPTSRQVRFAPARGSETPPGTRSGNLGPRGRARRGTRRATAPRPAQLLKSPPSKGRLSSVGRAPDESGGRGSIPAAGTRSSSQTR